MQQRNRQDDLLKIISGLRFHRILMQILYLFFSFYPIAHNTFSVQINIKSSKKFDIIGKKVFMVSILFAKILISHAYKR